MIEFKTGRALLSGQRVKVYKNLNRNCFSIMDKQSRLVLGWASSVMLIKAKFVISQSGQKKARKEQTRNVHAFVEGDFIAGDFVASNAFNPPVAREIQYNPFKMDFFIDSKSGKPVHEAPLVYLTDGKCFIFQKGGSNNGC